MEWNGDHRRKQRLLTNILLSSIGENPVGQAAHQTTSPANLLMMCPVATDCAPSDHDTTPVDSGTEAPADGVTVTVSGTVTDASNWDINSD